MSSSNETTSTTNINNNNTNNFSFSGIITKISNSFCFNKTKNYNDKIKKQVKIVEEIFSEPEITKEEIEILEKDLKHGNDLKLEDIDISSIINPPKEKEIIKEDPDSNFDNSELTSVYEFEELASPLSFNDSGYSSSPIISKNSVNNNGMFGKKLKKNKHLMLSKENLLLYNYLEEMNHLDNDELLGQKENWKILGRGYFSTVYEYKNFAIKYFNMNTSNFLLTFIQEAKVYKMLHENNVGYDDNVVLSELINWPTKFNNNYYIVMNKYHGNLSGLSRSSLWSRVYFTENNIFSMLYQIANGINVLHQTGVIHCDIKLDNIFYLLNHERVNNNNNNEDDASPSFLLYVGDYGISKILQEENYKYSFSPEKQYKPPEFWNSSNYSSISSSYDIYQFGILIYELITQQEWNQDLIFDKVSVLKTFSSKIQHFKKSQIIIDILSNILQINPSDRLKINDILFSLK
eukprot:TRINITY_DN1257_c0_g2_i1.p1 TRINITY_DN1257_c0_g2~~TRINITY_DN1257_c0_g2_i1.p1  ORF type:complete len:462 (+),score=113.40 TRINITY_DN1257_c0_g2_i1:268-1653(+)